MSSQLAAPKGLRGLVTSAVNGRTPSFTDEPREHGQPFRQRFSSFNVNQRRMQRPEDDYPEACLTE